MLEINTIAEFQALPLGLQGEIQKALRTKDRLEDFLRAMNNRNEPSSPKGERWEECKHCAPGEPGVCRHCKAWGHPGWVWREKERNDNDVHPSQINKCLKMLWYSCNGFTDELDEFIEPKLRMIFDLGHAWHDTVQRYGKSGAWGEPAGYRAEVPIDPDAKAFDGNPILPLAHRYWIRGHADAVLDRYIVPKVPGLGDVSIKVVHEYKTINSGQYSKLTRPKPEHKWQATMYSAVFDAPIAVYLYVNKDNCQLIDFPVAFDNSIWNAIVQKIDRVQHYTNSEQMPPWEETSAVQNKSECESCGYRKLCAPTAAQLVQIGGK